MAEATTQVNIRIDRALKQSADKAFAAAGLNPSKVVRAVYARASEIGYSLRSISDLVTSTAPAEGNLERDKRVSAFEQSLHALDKVAAQYELQVHTSNLEPMTEEEIEEAYCRDYLAGDAI